MSQIKRQLEEMEDILDLLSDLKESPQELEAEMANPKQRGYIHGLYKKLNFDEANLPIPVRSITFEQAKTLINELKLAVENREMGIWDFTVPMIKNK